jgi:hypothetical protein
LVGKRHLRIQVLFLFQYSNKKINFFLSCVVRTKKLSV